MNTDSIFSKRAGSDGHFSMLKRFEAFLVQMLLSFQKFLNFSSFETWFWRWRGYGYSSDCIFKSWFAYLLQTSFQQICSPSGAHDSAKYKANLGLKGLLISNFSHFLWIFVRHRPSCRQLSRTGSKHKVKLGVFVVFKALKTFGL